MNTQKLYSFNIGIGRNFTTKKQTILYEMRVNKKNAFVFMNQNANLTLNVLKPKPQRVLFIINDNFSKMCDILFPNNKSPLRYFQNKIRLKIRGYNYHKVRLVADKIKDDREVTCINSVHLLKYLKTLTEKRVNLVASGLIRWIEDEILPQVIKRKKKAEFCELKDDSLFPKEMLNEVRKEARLIENSKNSSIKLIEEAMKLNGEYNITLFEKMDLGKIRVKGDSENPLFCLSDVCGILEIQNSTITSNAIKLEFEDDLCLTYLIDNLGRKQKATFITEAQLYFVLMRSDKPKAKALRQWVINEVLPSIRKSGKYELHHTHFNAQVESVEQVKIQALKRENELLRQNNELLIKINKLLEDKE